MFHTNAYKTKTIMRPRKAPAVDDIWSIAIDTGYSSVKAISPNEVVCFPSFAKKLPKSQEFLGKESKNNILYEDENGNRWLVGANAQGMINANDTTTSSSGLYIRDRFASPMFKVIARTGFALVMQNNQYGSPAMKTPVVQTGLPPRHMNEYKEDIKEALAGEHEFKLKIGDKDWKTFRFTLPEHNISVMDQPMGSLISASMDRNGGPVPDATKYLNSNALVLDPGFGTCDTFNILNHRVTNNNTWDDLGMQRILLDTCHDIYDKYHEEITVPAMQKCLAEGTIRVRDRKNRTCKPMPFGEILEANLKSVCDEMLQTIDENYDGLMDHDYLIVTGGLGDAWFNRIKNYYSGNEALTVVAGNCNDPELEGLFSNVRGYYMNLLNNLKSGSYGR